MIHALIILLPLLLLAPGLIDLGQQQTLIAGSLFIIGSLIKDRMVRYFAYYAGVWIIFIRIMFTYIGFSRPQVPSATGQIIFITLGLIVYHAAASGKYSKESIYNAICITALIQAFLGICQFFGIRPLFEFYALFSKMRWPENVSSYVCGSLRNPNFLSAYLAISIPFFFRRGWKYLIPVILIPMLMAKSAGGIIAVMVGASVFYGVYKKNFIPAGVLLVVGVLTVWVMNGAENFTGNRVTLWWIPAAKEIFSSKMAVIFGFGPGAPTVFTPNKSPLHNEWLQCWWYYGVIGFAAAVVYFFRFQRTDKIIYIAFIIASATMFVNYGMHIAPSAALMMVIMGMGERVKYGGLPDISKHH